MKKALVTGSSRGIGRAIALAFAEKGYHVFLNCNHSVIDADRVRAEIEAIPGASCDIAIGDVGNPDNVNEMFKKIYKHCDALDVLVNNAGISHIGLMSEMSTKEWNRLIQTNLSSVFYCSHEAVPKMVAKKAGKSLIFPLCGEHLVLLAKLHTLHQKLVYMVLPRHSQKN